MTSRRRFTTGSLVTFGEILLRLATQGAGRLAQASHLDVTFAGAEINAAVAAARWGLPSRFVTALPENPWAEIVAGRLRQARVELVAHPVRASRLGVYFVEHGFGSRPAQVVYDRTDSAFATHPAGKYRWPELLRDAAWFHTSGITPALSPAARRACGQALRAAKRGGLRTSFDLNYRRALWPPAEAGRVLRRLVAGVDLLMGAEDVFTEILGTEPVGVLGPDGRPRTDAIAALCAEISARHRVGAVLISLRNCAADGRLTLAAGLHAGGRLWVSRTHALDVVDRLGAGDAMAGVLIAGLQQGVPPHRALEEAVAAAALKHTTVGDFITTSPEEVRAWLAGSQRGRVNR
jgi:2-dehydro-3-deoxygluconokinase